MSIRKIRAVYVRSFPKTLEDGVLYISRRFSSACHRCCCGFGTKTVTPIRRTEYRLIDTGGRVSLYPSIGNWNHPCQAHYVIRDGKVLAAGNMTRSEIAEGHASDEAEKRACYSKVVEPWHTAAL